MSEAPARGRSLADWLDRLGFEHPKTVERGLAHVGAVADRMGLRQPAPLVAHRKDMAAVGLEPEPAHTNGESDSN